ncbi:hypothetical protein C8Q75DRAFT_264006 [Abortiporus biennis]|nr:hypothetical protein C8Q75DRAFT_264006 [Abortiporus biennis]
MFSRGNRFPPQKVPEVPAPNAYNVQDPEWDAYKRGAFLEKTDRFSKEKESDIPGPGTYETDFKMKPVKNVRVVSGDRTAHLQRKVDELERLLQESKKAHIADTERLKMDLSRAQRTNVEQAERIDKFKKQNDALDSRLQELKKTAEKEHCELKDLKTKLRLAEHERNQLQSKQGEVGEAKKALQALDSKRRDELRDRDKRIIELEKALTSERRKRESLENRLNGVKGKADEELEQAKVASKALEMELQHRKVEAEDARSTLATLRGQAAATEESLVAQLEQHRTLLSRVAEEYGRLASTRIPREQYETLRKDNLSKQFRVLRLERKLANTEGQVVELANLIRCGKEQNHFLSITLAESENLAFRLSSALMEAYAERESDVPLFVHSIQDGLTSIGQELHSQELLLQRSLIEHMSSWNDFYALRNHQWILHSSFMMKHLDDKDIENQQQCMQLDGLKAEHAALTQTNSVLRTEYETAHTQLVESTTALAQARGEVEFLSTKVKEVEEKSKSSVEEMKQVVTREKEVNRRLASTLQQHKQAEEAMRLDVDQLANDLAEAERYEEAYNNLVDEVGALVDRNALAEEEAERLRKFNAEIVGHNNPAQRVMYVDRIRRELHETRQKLLISTREREAVLNENDDLRHELDMYKSVSVHPELKPRTTVTRVSRVPLATQSMNIKSLSAISSVSNGGKRLESTPEVDFKEGDMTIEEIL